jgi:hypothetical protein
MGSAIVTSKVNNLKRFIPSFLALAPRIKRKTAAKRIRSSGDTSTLFQLHGRSKQA